MKLTPNKLNWGALSAVFALVLIAGYDLLWPKPQPTGSKSGLTVAQLEKEKDRVFGTYEESKTKVKSQTWQMAADQVGPEAMSWVSRQAQANFVNVSAFRPQRSVETAGLNQLNYLVTAEGPFLNVMKFIKAFESEGSLLAVKTVQIASANGATDAVRASIGVIAFKEGTGG